MGASPWIVIAGRLFFVSFCALASLALRSTATAVVEDHHAPRLQLRSLQSSSSIVFINAIAGAAFTPSEEDAVQLQVRVF